MKTALLISHSKDFYTIDQVTDHLQENKIKVIRFNTDLFPEEIRINEKINSESFSIEIQTKQVDFKTSEIDVVWQRKIWKPLFKNPIEAPYFKASINETIAVRTAFFQTLNAVPWLDAIPNVIAASDKFFQLRMAQAVGLNIPKTIISNDEKAVINFYKNLNGKMICKLHTALTTSMKGSEFSFYTTLIDEENLVDLDMLNICPMIFQEFIPKAYELRVAYIDGKCYTGKIKSGDPVDWRKPGVQFFWESYIIPPSLKEKLIALMQKLDLSFGAIDLIVRPNGQYVFLEVNPVGEWGMLEKELDLPISQAIAEGLIKRLV